MAPRTLCDDGDSQPPYKSKRTSARTRQPRQLSFHRAPALLRRPRHHTNRVPKPLRLPRRHVLRALALLCYTPHCTPGSSPYAYKTMDQGPLTEGWPREDEDGTGARVRPLAPSPAWTLVTPYCKRTRPGRRTNTKAAGFPPLSRPPPAAFPSPLRAQPRADPSGLGHAATFHSSARGPPGFETPTSLLLKCLWRWMLERQGCVTLSARLSSCHGKLEVED
jgi:hypothetical protein